MTDAAVLEIGHRKQRHSDDEVHNDLHLLLLGGVGFVWGSQSRSRCGQRQAVRHREKVSHDKSQYFLVVMSLIEGSLHKRWKEKTETASSKREKQEIREEEKEKEKEKKR